MHIWHGATEVISLITIRAVYLACQPVYFSKMSCIQCSVLWIIKLKVDKIMCLRLHLITWCDKVRIASSLFTEAVITTSSTASGAHSLYKYGCNDYMWGFIKSNFFKLVKLLLWALDFVLFCFQLFKRETWVAWYSFMWWGPTFFFNLKFAITPYVLMCFKYLRFVI